jgi:hypothetical protein
VAKKQGESTELILAFDDSFAGEAADLPCLLALPAGRSFRPCCSPRLPPWPYGKRWLRLGAGVRGL